MEAKFMNVSRETSKPPSDQGFGPGPMPIFNAIFFGGHAVAIVVVLYALLIGCPA